MNAEEAVAAVSKELAPWAKETKLETPRRLYVRIDASDVVAASRAMFERLGARFATATGVDGRDAIEVLYHWCLDGAGIVATIRTEAPKPDVTLDSITGVLPAALWIEREMHELLGVEFRGHPKLEPLLLADDWPAGVYPLRRDFDPSQASRPDDRSASQ